MAPAPQNLSLYEAATALVIGRWRIVRWAVAGAVLGALSVVTKPALYVAATSFVAQGTESSRSGLASLAGQFGVSIAGTGDQSQSPDFYVALLRTRALLVPITHDTFVVAEEAGARKPFSELFNIRTASAPALEEAGVKVLRDLVSPGVSKSTGVVDVSVRTRWPSVSHAIVTRLVAGLNDFNSRTRQTQAREERRFVESLLAKATDSLEAHEASLARFEEANKVWDVAPALRQAHDRLIRAIASQQALVTSLRESNEQARIREVRDTPAITVIDSPWVATTPDPRGRLTRVILAGLLGGAIGVGMVLLSAMLSSQRAAGGGELAALNAAFADARSDFRRLLRRG
jgi:uncharacterized protein involved in exopolysaccharide biosynthesis